MRMADALKELSLGRTWGLPGGFQSRAAATCLLYQARPELRKPMVVHRFDRPNDRRSLIMADKTEQFSELNRKNMEVAMRMAQLSIENSQRIVALQSELAKEMFQSGVENAKAQTSASDPQAMLQLRAQYAQETTQRMVAAAQQIAEISNTARAEFSRLVTEQLASGSQDMAESMQTFMKSLPGQTPNMMESLQQAIATANAAFAQISKASMTAMSSAGETVRKAAGGS